MILENVQCGAGAELSNEQATTSTARMNSI